MENYDVITMAGQGSYGIVLQCRHKVSNRIVAVKKLINIERNSYVRKMVVREIRILKKLRHENLVRLLEVLKIKKRVYLVFEYLNKSVLDDLQDNPNGLGEKRTRKYMYELIRAIEYCHDKNVIHRDIKPENLLVSKNGTLKLCDFGFARIINSLQDGDYTEYIATRWYRAPELLVRDKEYGKAIDIWAIGCVCGELLTGEPLFPGDSDVDQLYQITMKLGNLCSRHQNLLINLGHSKEMGSLLNKNVESRVMNNVHALHRMFPTWSTYSLNFVALCLHLDPSKRPSATQLLQHGYFDKSNFKKYFQTSSATLKKKKRRKSYRELKYHSACVKSMSTARAMPEIPVISFNDDEKPLLPLKPLEIRIKNRNISDSPIVAVAEDNHSLINANEKYSDSCIQRSISPKVERIIPSKDYQKGFEFFKLLRNTIHSGANNNCKNNGIEAMEVIENERKPWLKSEVIREKRAEFKIILKNEDINLANITLDSLSLRDVTQVTQGRRL